MWPLYCLQLIKDGITQLIKDGITIDQVHLTLEFTLSGGILNTVLFLNVGKIYFTA